MRKLIVSTIISLDGYFEGENRNVMALPMDAAFDAHNAERLQAADVLLFGATTYRLFAAYWPGLEHDTTAAPVLRRISHLNNAISKVVVSDGMESNAAGPWRETTRIVRRRDAPTVITELKAEASEKDIILFGSRTLARELLQANLVDEVHLMIGAAVLGAGTPAFVEPPAARLELIGARTWKDSNNVLLRYAVVR
jgi:dihydrofolate reductase